uniref:WAP domain-containing protein n=1 Tax=Marmota marmota marmota TaxID=9994 RepID=A0A8C6A277_MARMA
IFKGVFLILCNLCLSLRHSGFQLVCSNLGACAELCRGDWDCGPGEHCVSTGCGHDCASD